MIPKEPAQILRIELLGADVAVFFKNRNEEFGEEEMFSCVCSKLLLRALYCSAANGRSHIPSVIDQNIEAGFSFQEGLCFLPGRW